MTSCYDEIHIENLEIFAHHGVLPEETRLGQKFLISLTMYLDVRPAGTADCLEKTVHYGEVSGFLTAYLQKHTYQLIEAAAEHLAEELLLRYPPLKGVTLEMDLLMYDDEVLETEDLVIPHVEMHLRDFVLKPLREIAPNKRHPIYQKTVSELADSLCGD